MTAPSRSGTMRLLRSRDELRDALQSAPRPLGLVPTMGWLHDGHRSLMARARAENATTIATIFVNPRQFNEAADYQRYPRNEARDLAICEDEGVDLVFAPDVDEVYPPGFDTAVTGGAIARPLEGAARPGHFDGVATVVAILFNLVGAERAYFGQKDAQQVMVIRQMARDLAIPTRVIACPTVREADGLALSSRNVHLTADERAAAPVLHRALHAARARWEAGERSGDALRAAMHDVLATEPLARPEYVSVADGRTLAELDALDGPALLSLAVRFGATRLIDNEPLEPATA
jgi:pantoate--beta-alanine ligase